MKTTVPLALALVVSVLLNIVLLRREASTPAPSPAPAPVERSSSAAVAAVEDDDDKILLREEVRLLRNQLAVAKVHRELERNSLRFSTDDAAEQPETRDFQGLLELVQSFIETREAEARDEQGRLVKVAKPVLTPQNRDAALRAIGDYLGLEESARPSFHEWAQSAIDAYRRDMESYAREVFAAAKAGENDEFFEEDARRKQDVTDRMNRRHEEWRRDHVKPIQDFLDRRDGVRPSLLSHNLPNLLSELGSPDER